MALSLLLNGFPRDRFFSDFWEKMPLLVRCSGKSYSGSDSGEPKPVRRTQSLAAREGAMGAAAGGIGGESPSTSSKKRKREKSEGDSLFTMAELKTIVSRGGVFFRVHLNAFRYLGGDTKEDCVPDGGQSGPPVEVTVGVLEHLFGVDGKAKKEKRRRRGRGSSKKRKEPTPRASFQFHQPQHHSDRLWSMMHALESDTQTLWGANVYLTPVSHTVSRTFSCQPMMRKRIKQLSAFLELTGNLWASTPLFHLACEARSPRFGPPPR